MRRGSSGTVLAAYGNSYQLRVLYVAALWFGRLYTPLALKYSLRVHCYCHESVVAWKGAVVQASTLGTACLKLPDACWRRRCR